MSDSAIANPALTSAGAFKIAVGATLATFTLPVYSAEPPSVSMTLPRTANVPLSLGVQVMDDVLVGAEYVPAPQSNEYWSAAASTGEGSVPPVSESVKLEPSLPAAGELNVADGGRSPTVIVCVLVVGQPNASVTMSVAVKLP